jgi:serine/threonine protein kinase
MNNRELAHPNRSQLEWFVHGKLEDEERERIEQHVAECDSCCEILRSVPHEPLVERMRCTDTSTGETMSASMPDTERRTKIESGIPAELVDHPRYRIIEQLGAGGMGVVYHAEHRLMERPVALKVINARLVADDVAIERFRLEVKAAAKLSHRNIVAAFDAEQAGDLHFLVMEFIEGTSLAELVQRRGKLSVLHCCNYAMQAAIGLEHAYERGMVHRGIKPHNLMRTATGTVKILDFGLARFASHQNAEDKDSGLTGAGATLGTPDYIAPEQARDSRRADIRADIYSLGCTLYYMLSGRVPFPKSTAVEKVVAHCEHEPTRISELRDDIPREVIRIVETMMAKDPADRFQTPTELVEALKPFGKPVAATPQATIDTTTAQQRTTTEETPVDHSPTLPPLEQIDPLEIRQVEQQAPLGGPTSLSPANPRQACRRSCANTESF